MNFLKIILTLAVSKAAVIKNEVNADKECSTNEMIQYRGNLMTCATECSKDDFQCLSVCVHEYQTSIEKCRNLTEMKIFQEAAQFIGVQ